LAIQDVNHRIDADPTIDTNTPFSSFPNGKQRIYYDIGDSMAVVVETAALNNGGSALTWAQSKNILEEF